MSTRRHRPPLSLLALAAVLLGGCVVGPDYRRPETVPPESFAQAASARMSLYQTSAPEAAWWSRLDDPILDDLIQEARQANPDLRVAEAHVRAARALLGLERRERWPSAAAGAAAERSEASTVRLPPEIDRTQTLYSAALDARWELDLFGRIRRAVEARTAEYEATVAERRAVFVAIAGEIGRTYMELRGTQRRLEVARANVENQQATLDLVDALLTAGRGTELDLARARAQLETTRSLVPTLEVAEAGAIHRLAVLVGQPPTALTASLAPTSELPPVPERISIGDPAALLRRRPDIEAAERRLAAATAEIGVAVADLFPRVSLTGSFGSLATSLEDLGTGATRTTSFGPFLRWAAFDLGQVRNRIRAVEAGSEATLALYEKTVLEALEETENALIRLDRARIRQAHLRLAERAADDAAELARVRYRSGLDSFLAVLDAESRLLGAQDALAQSATETGAAFVALYEALGGGWEVS